MDLELSTRIDDLKDFAKSISNSITKMSAAERQKHVTGELAAEYNTLLAMTLKERPDREEVMPPKITIETLDYGTLKGQMNTTTAHVDLDSYCQRIFRILSNG